jgi:hypothetical protein
VRYCGLNSSRSGYGPMARSCEDGKEKSASMKGKDFLDYLSEF